MNIYYNPEDAELEIVGEVEWDDEPYCFNLTVVLRKGDVYYWADDSGCSCPSPFEDHQFPGDFESGTKFQVAAALQEKLSNLSEWGNREHAEREVAQLIDQIMR